MQKKNTFKKIVVSSIVVGTAMHAANQYIIKKATAKNLLNNQNGNFYSFKYGNIFYKTSGNGKPLLLVHDLDECSSGMEWFYLEKKLAKKYKVYTIDLLGCGRSEKPKLAYNQFLYTQLIYDFIHDVIKEKTDIIATGKSAASVIMSAKLHSEAFRRLILINPCDLDELGGIPDAFGTFRKYLLNIPVVGTFIYHLTHTKDAVFDRFITKYFSDSASDFSEICEYYYETSHKDHSAGKYLYIQQQCGHLSMNINHALKSLKNDILIISGDDYYEADYVPEEYAAFNDNVECISIKETSYLPQLEDPSKIMNVIREYLQ